MLFLIAIGLAAFLVYALLARKHDGTTIDRKSSLQRALAFVTMVIAVLEFGYVWLVMGAMATAPNARNMSVVATLAVVALGNGVIAYQRAANTNWWPQVFSMASLILIVGGPIGFISYIAFKGG